MNAEQATRILIRNGGELVDSFTQNSSSFKTIGEFKLIETKQNIFLDYKELLAVAKVLRIQNKETEEVKNG